MVLFLFDKMYRVVVHFYNSDFNKIKNNVNCAISFCLAQKQKIEKRRISHRGGEKKTETKNAFFGYNNKKKEGVHRMNTYNTLTDFKIRRKIIFSLESLRIFLQKGKK